jgi:putative flippase GtrA
MRSWVANQSDQVHAGLCVGATAVLLPVLPSLSPTLLATTNLASTSIQFGAQFYVAFVGGPTMYLNLNRQTFGDIQSRLFPKFGMVGVSSSIISLASYHLAHTGIVDVASCLLSVSLSVHLINTFLLFPAVTRHMIELRRVDGLEDGEDKVAERKRAGRRFGISHGVSNLINLASLAANLGYIYILAANLRW